MIYALLGAVAIGLVLGLLGSGGSILTVPVLVYLAGQPDKVAIAESLAIVGAIAAFGALPYARQKQVDVRFASEYAEGHVPGAINASYTRLPDYVEQRIPHGKTLLVHCATGARSAAASAFLARAGYDVRYVSDSFPDYAAAHEVETGKPALATA